MRYPDAHCELDFTSPFELLVATVLSAQTTDVRVNLTTPILFARYPDAAALAAANPEEVEEILRPTGFFRAKTKSVMGLSRALVERFRGEVPGAAEGPGDAARRGTQDGQRGARERVRHPRDHDGHARHAALAAARLHHERGPAGGRAGAGALLPRKDWTMASHRLIFHGRRTCFARKPACGACPVASMCPSAGIGEIDPVKAAAMVKGVSVGATSRSQARSRSVTRSGASSAG